MSTSRNAAISLQNHKPYLSGSARVQTTTDTVSGWSISCLFYGEHRLVRLEGNTLTLNYCGWATQTTRRYINACLGIFNLPPTYSRHKAIMYGVTEIPANGDVNIYIPTGEIL